MEQQLEPQPLLPQKHLWVEDDDDEEEVGVGLLARSSRHSIDGVGNTSTSTGELRPGPASASANGTSYEHFDREEEEEEEAAPTADGGNRNEEVGDVKEEDKVAKGKGGGTGNSVYFDKLEGSESINGISEMQSEIPKIPRMEVNHQVKIMEDQNSFGLSPAPIEQLHEETNTSLKHLENATKVDANIDLIGEIEEDFMELDVEKVLEKQNTHDLYCPNCNSCITRRVILRRRKPQISNIRRKPKREKKLDPIPNSVGDGHSGDKPEISSDVSPTVATDEQKNGTEQHQEAFSCLSCFSLFIPIGNGCFKIFQFFRQGRQNEHAQSPLEISQRENMQSSQQIGQREIIQNPQGINSNENTPQQISQKEKTPSLDGMSQRENIQIPQGINLIESAQSPEEISQREKAQILQRMSQDEFTETPQKVSLNQDTGSPQKQSRNEDTHSPQHINHNEGAQYPQNINSNEDRQSSRTISCNEDRQSPQKISLNENTRSLLDINQNESKQSPQKTPTAKTNWIFSIFAFNKGKAAIQKVQSVSVPTSSISNGEHIDGAAIKPKEPGISNIFSSTNSSRLDKVKPEPRENEADADIFQRNAGDNEIEDIEAGLLNPTLYPRTEVAPSSQSRTQMERRSAGTGEAQEWEILKSIVYGGLIESITSLGVVSSAAGAGADTVNVLALGLANLIGGLLLISHNLRELKNDQSRGASTEINNEEDRYHALLGRRQNFALHATVAILSFLIFGLVAPVVYGFSFRKSDDKDLKLAAVAGASLVCIILLSLGKGHVRKPHRTYFRTVSYYVILGIMASGISYLVGELIKKLLDQLGLFELSSAFSVPSLETIPSEVGRASY